MSDERSTARKLLRRISFLLILASISLAFIYALGFGKVGEDVVMEGSASYEHPALSSMLLTSQGKGKDVDDICIVKGDEKNCTCGDNHVMILQDKISQAEANHCIGFCGNSDNFPVAVKATIGVQTFFKAWVYTPILRQLPDAAVRMWTAGECFDKQGFKEFLSGGTQPCEPKLRKLSVHPPKWISFGSFGEHFKELYSGIFFFIPRSIIMAVYDFFVRHRFFTGWLRNPISAGGLDGWFIWRFLKGLWSGSTHIGVESVKWSWSQVTHPWWVMGWPWYLVPLELMINCVLFMVHTFLIGLILAGIALLWLLVAIVLAITTVLQFPVGLLLVILWVPLVLIWDCLQIFVIGGGLFLSSFATVLVVLGVAFITFLFSIVLPGGPGHLMILVLFETPDVIARAYGWASLWPSAMLHTFYASCKGQYFPFQTLHNVWAWAPTVIKWSWNGAFHPWWILGWPWWGVPLEIIINVFLWALHTFLYGCLLFVGALTFVADLVVCAAIAIFGVLSYVLIPMVALATTILMILAWALGAVLTVGEVFIYVLITSLISLFLMFFVLPIFFVIALLYGSGMYLLHGYIVVVCFKSVVGYIFGGMATSAGPIFAVICMVVGAQIASWTSTISVEYDMAKMYPVPFKNAMKIMEKEDDDLWKTTEAYCIDTDDTWHYFELEVKKTDLLALINDDKKTDLLALINDDSKQQLDGSSQAITGTSVGGGAGNSETVWCGFFVRMHPGPPIMHICSLDYSGQVEKILYSEWLRVSKKKPFTITCDDKTKQIIDQGKERIKFKQNEWKFKGKEGKLELAIFTAKVTVAVEEQQDVEIDVEKSEGAEPDAQEIQDASPAASKKESKFIPISPDEVRKKYLGNSRPFKEALLDELKKKFKDLGIDRSGIKLMKDIPQENKTQKKSEKGEEASENYTMVAHMIPADPNAATPKSQCEFFVAYTTPRLKVTMQCEPMGGRHPTKMVPWFGMDCDIFDKCQSTIEKMKEQQGAVLNKLGITFLTTNQHLKGKAPLVMPEQSNNRSSSMRKGHVSPGTTDTPKRRCWKFWRSSKDDKKKPLLPTDEKAETAKRRWCSCCPCRCKSEPKQSANQSSRAMVASYAEDVFVAPPFEDLKWVIDYYKGEKHHGESHYQDQRKLGNIKLIFESGGTDLEFSGSKPGQSLSSRVFAIFICTDAFSETSQTINFLHNGQPIYCALSFLGILWNVIEGIMQIPPTSKADALGRAIQADVMESVLQLFKYKQYTKLFFVKKSIKARTQKLMHLPVIFFALTNLRTTHNTMLPEVGAFIQSYTGLSGYWTDWVEFAICFGIFAGNIGILSSATLSIISFAFGLGEAEQWVEAFEKVEELEAIDERKSSCKRNLKGKKWFFKPQWRYRIVYICHSLGMFIGMSSGYACLSTRMKTVSATFVLLVFFSRLPLFASTATWEQHYKVTPFLGKVQFHMSCGGLREIKEEKGTCGPCARILSLVVMSVFFVVHPYGYMWPTKLSMRGPPKNYFTPNADPSGTDKENAEFNLKRYRFAFAWFFLTHAACFSVLWYFVLFTDLRQELVFMRNYDALVNRGGTNIFHPLNVMATIPLVQMLLTILGCLSTIATVPVAIWITFTMKDSVDLDQWWYDSLYNNAEEQESTLEKEGDT